MGCKASAGPGRRWQPRVSRSSPSGMAGWRRSGAVGRRGGGAAVSGLPEPLAAAAPRRSDGRSPAPPSRVVEAPGPPARWARNGHAAARAPPRIPPIGACRDASADADIRRRAACRGHDPRSPFRLSDQPGRVTATDFGRRHDGGPSVVIPHRSARSTRLCRHCGTWSMSVRCRAISHSTGSRRSCCYRTGRSPCSTLDACICPSSATRRGHRRPGRSRCCHPS